MKKYIENYEKWLVETKEKIDKNKLDRNMIDKILIFHEKQILFIQHERLIHLIITIITGILFLLSSVFYLFIPFKFFIIIPLIFVVVLLFYIQHYCFLENTVQKWYKIYNEIYNKLYENNC